MKHTEWTPELVEALALPFPRNLHMNKGAKGTFVSVHHYVARLNELVGPQGWSMPEPSTFHAGNKIGMAVGITILGVTKWNVGDEMEDHGEPDEDGKVRDYGSSSTNSFAQAFKRCLAYGFGCGLYLYDKDATKAYLNGGQRNESPTVVRTQSTALPPRPKADAAHDTLATVQQLSALAILVDVHDIPYEERGGLMTELKSEALTFARAKEIILHVQKLPKLPFSTAGKTA